MMQQVTGATGETSLVTLGLGSNIGDRLAYLSYAIGQLNEGAGEITAISSVWETEPWGFRAEELFLNAAVILRTTLEPADLLNVINRIEARLGRKRRRSSEYQSRVIDIDILLWESRTLAIPGLQIPHPRLEQRRFVLEPVCEIAPEALHPVTHKTMRELLALCDDTSDVRKLPDGLQSVPLSAKL